MSGREDLEQFHRNVAIVGATGIAGHQFVAALASDRWFPMTRLGASSRSAGMTYRTAPRDEALGRLPWWAGGKPPCGTFGIAVEEAT
jgi:aspartate-semialdehyde dehydrogenase